MNQLTDLRVFPGLRLVFRRAGSFLFGVVMLAILISCRSAVPAPIPFDHSVNLDSETQNMIANARQVVFLIPFSHWDTDWHESFDVYSIMADRNIQAAIDLAKAQPRFRYALEQVFFVQHFWESHPESRADLKALVENRQLTFAWAGITQPETSLAAPGVQWHNLLEGQRWIAETFGEQYIPSTAWQSDAFGNSAGLPIFLSQTGVTRMFLGRWGQRCPVDQEDCQRLPQAFYWVSPLLAGGGRETDRILVASVPYATAWGTLLNKNSMEEKITAFQAVIEEQFDRSASRFIFLPYGFDFYDPDPALMDLVDAWNSTNRDTVLVMSDPETAFHYLATGDLPEIQVDLNPLWQAFYGTRPYARIADKESEFYLTATDKFGQFLEPPQAGDWSLASINTHYDNLSAVSYDRVWAESQRPRFQAAVDQAANTLTTLLASIAGRVMANQPDGLEMLFFNSLSWDRGGVIDVHGVSPEMAQAQLPFQPIDPDTAAVYLEPLPAMGYSIALPSSAPVGNPAIVTREGDLTTLSNGLVSVRLNAARGGAFDRLGLMDAPSVNLLDGAGDDLVYIQDDGDVYGARFGEEVARQSQSPAHVALLAEGPLLARVQVTLSLGGQPVTKTITLRADSALIEVALQMRALPESSALIRTSTSIQTDVRTDDLGFAAFEHIVDPRPIQPGDITYRRHIFYPITYWSDVSSNGYGLSLITHGLQGVGGTQEFILLLARSVTDSGDRAREGVTDTEQYTFRYAYYPHRGDAQGAQPWIEAYGFNQPIIPVWRAGDRLAVQLPFQNSPTVLPFIPAVERLSGSGSLASVEGEGAVVVDSFRQSGQTSTLVVNYQPFTSVSLKTAAGEIVLPSGWLSITTR